MKGEKTKQLYQATKLKKRCPPLLILISQRTDKEFSSRTIEKFSFLFQI